MTVPGFEQFMLPTLRLLADGTPRPTRGAANEVARTMGLSDDDLSETIASGQKTYLNRGQWAQTYLFQAGLIERPRRGFVAISAEGRDALAVASDVVDISFLGRYPRFEQFRSRRGTRRRSDPLSETPAAGDTTSLPAHDLSSSTPEDLMTAAQDENRASVEAEVLARVLELTPSDFERLILKLLTAMGYGTSDAAEHTGRSGDEGIDGIIRRDALGLDRVYLQAKRYTDAAVGPEAVNAFFGALRRKGADRGVFITSSTFTSGARAAERDFQKIVLIDGIRLAELMVEHNVGAQDQSTYVLKRIDEDYFESL